jgi:sialic acid synthase SpsE
MIEFSENKTLLVAEIGWNFLGELNLAKKMIDAAKQSGAHAVKFQVWNPYFLKNGKWDVDGRREIYEKAHLNIKKYKELLKFSKKKKIICFASVFTLREAKLLHKIGEKIIKIPSHEAYNIPLIEFAIKNFKHVLISVGALKKNELLKLLKYKKLKKITIMHCVSSYPLNENKCNFFKFDFLKNNFINVGYSGHYTGVEDAIFAIAKGARIIEKHFTINQKLPGRDNRFSLLPKDFKIISNFIKITHNFNKNLGLDLQKCEVDIYKNYRDRWNEKI